MFLEQKTFIVKSGAGRELAERFSQGKLVVKQPGFIRIDSGISFGQDTEEVCVMIFWDTKESFLNWKKSDDHINDHKDRRKNDAVLEHRSKQFELV